MAKEREINGRSFPRREFVNYLMKAVEIGDPEKPTVQAILDVWKDPEWDCKAARFALSQELNNLTRQGKLTRLDRGRYAVTKAWKVSGQGEWHQREQEIIDILREEGGIIRWRDLMRRMGVTENAVKIGTGPHAPTVDGTGGGPLLRRAIQSSARIRRDFEIHHSDVSAIPQDRKKTTGMVSNKMKRKRAETTASRNFTRLPRDHGFINLPQSEMATLPRHGRWVGRMTKVAMHNMGVAGMMTNDVKWAGEVDRQLRHVGQTISAACDLADVDLVELLEAPAICTALDGAIERYRDGYQELEKIDDDDDRRLRMLYKIVGGTETVPAPSAFDRNAVEERDMFRVSAHMALDGSFYEAVADFFYLNAAALSRGIIEPEVGEPGDDWAHFFSEVQRLDAEDDAGTEP